MALPEPSADKRPEQLVHAVPISPKGVSQVATGLGDGRKTVTAAATAEALAASTPAIYVVVTALVGNTGIVVVGGSTVVAAAATRRGTPLSPGQSMGLPVDDLADVYLDVTVSGEGVSYTYLT